MKPGRNEPCPCGSGKKFKHCCIDAVGKQHAEIADDIEQIMAANPDLTIDELNAVLNQRMHSTNEQPREEFCGLTPGQMYDWLYSPPDEIRELTIATPEDLSASPVMSYLALMLDEAVQNDGAIKATSRGNLSAQLVKRASDLLPRFAIAEYETMPSISEYTGSNEDKFNALHYTRVLAEATDIISYEGKAFKISKKALQQYQANGINAFFKPMLMSAITRYNWCYMDGLPQDLDIKTFWAFMLWRLQSHGSVDQLFDEVAVAFPDLVRELPHKKYSSQQDQLGRIIDTRFIERFLQFWGFITVNPRRVRDGKPIPIKANIQPLFGQTFRFAL